MPAGLAAGGVVAALFVAFLLRTRVPAPVSMLLLASAGGAVAWGGMLLQTDPSDLQVALAVAAMAVLAPLHVRVVLGPFGPS